MLSITGISGSRGCGHAGVSVSASDLQLWRVDRVPRTPAEAATAVGIDWASILDRSSMTPDVTLPAGSWPSSSTFSTGWPIIYVDQPGSFALPGDGRGILSAATRFSGLVPYRNTSVDNWATY